MFLAVITAWLFLGLPQVACYAQGYLDGDDYTDPCEQREQLPAELHFVAGIPDITGDGLPDEAFLNTAQHAGSVWLVDGASGDLIIELLPAVHDRAFGLLVFPAGDTDGDGTLDIAVSSHVRFTSGQIQPRLTVFSTHDGTAIMLVYLTNTQDGYIALSAMNPKDLDASMLVDEEDVIIAAESIVTQNALSGADLNRDGIIDTLDVSSVVLEWLGPSDIQLYDLEIAINAAIDGTEASPLFIGWIKDIIDCLGCLIRCADAYDDAWECRGKYWDAYCACWELQDGFDQAACLDDVRLNFMADCIADVAAAAGACGECILECHPLAP